jgi:hypothetical protein
MKDIECIHVARRVESEDLSRGEKLNIISRDVPARDLACKSFT